MSARGRGYAQDWDPMREDFDNSGYDPQYPDDSSSGFVSLDHTRLYVTNIPRGLSDEGVFAAFSKYGRTTEQFVSQNPEKRYGLIAFETPGEAKLAMMKLNRTEPLGLNVRVAHKRKPKDENSNRVSRPNDRDRDGRTYDAGSVGSRSNPRRPQDLANGDNMEDLLDDDVGLNNSLDADTNLELEHLKLEQLKLQEAQLLCKQRMFLLKQAEKKASSTSRRVLPNGQIFVCNNERSDTGRDADASFVAGAGDSRVGKCVACGERADAFCGGCGVTPYCTASCQRRDWHDRHRKVCHNLKRTSGAGLNVSRAEPDLEPEPAMSAAAPLRRPRSPEPARGRRDDDSGSDRAPPRKFGPPGSHANVPTTQPIRGSYRNSRGGTSRANQSHDRSDDKPRAANDRSDDSPRNSNDRSGDKSRAAHDRSDDKSRAAHDRPDDRSRSHQNGDRARQNNRGNEGRERRPRTDDAGRSSDTVRDDKKEKDEWNAAAGPAPRAAPAAPGLQPRAAAAPGPAPAPALQPRARAVAEEPPREAPAPAAEDALLPKHAMIDLLAVNDCFTLSVEALASECRAGAGFVCLALHEDYSEQYMRLLSDAFTQRQEASAACTPTPGETFSYLNPEDGGWYRARCVAPAAAALLDGSRVVPLTAASSCRMLPAEDCEPPEFCCVLEDAQVELGDRLSCTITAKAGGVLALSLARAEAAGAPGAARARRWLPRVDRAPAPACPVIPEVPRPPLTNNSRVVVVDAARPGRVVVRPAAPALQRRFDDVVADAAQHGAAASPLTEAPAVGQTLLARFSDGVHYRALCRRVNGKLRKCLLEYVEYGNEDVAFFDQLFPCPAALRLEACPTLASVVSLSMPQEEFTPAALDYLNKLKDDAVELTLTLPSGEQTAASGAAARLGTARGEDVGRAAEALCTPAWRRLLARGGDVLEFETMYDKDVEYVDVPACGGDLDIADTSALQAGVLAGHVRGAPHAGRALALAPQLAEYCNSPLCRDPYLPKPDEVCIALCPTTNQWVRALLVQQASGAGGAEADLLLLDRGCVARVAVAALRKMPPEFLRALPAAVCTLEIRDFPREPTDAQISRALRHMQVDAGGRGALRVVRAARQDLGEYVVDAPDLIRAMEG